MNDSRKELREAISAADAALEALSEVQDKLHSAGNWGIADMLGGGMLTTLVKHHRMNQAQTGMAEVGAALSRLGEELEDVAGVTDLHLEDNLLLTYADFFHDGLFADFLMQNKIGRAREKVEEIYRDVERVRDRLEREL